MRVYLHHYYRTPWKFETPDNFELTYACLKLIMWFFFHLADLLTIEHHKPSPKPKKQESKLGDWYYQDGSVVKDTLQRKGILSIAIKTWYLLTFVLLKQMHFQNEKCNRTNGCFSTMTTFYCPGEMGRCIHSL